VVGAKHHARVNLKIYEPEGMRSRPRPSDSMTSAPKPQPQEEEVDLSAVDLSL
ncbi:MAG TPA: RNA-binding protein, partial [Candidatus Kerfeldbacteria bacterium]|nr:RNA-binding protein [Candidatus Kerfeldbacteria bacterium]